MEKSKYRLDMLKKIEELEKAQLWKVDIEDDPQTRELRPEEIDYCNKKLSSKVKTYFANLAGQSFFEKMIKNKQLIIENITGIENFVNIKGGAILTCNHFNICDNYAVWRVIRPYMKRKRLYKVIKEGNYTNAPKPFGFVMRNCNTLPLSSNIDTMKKFLKSVDLLLKKGENILIYPEQSMWWNYRKPRPLQEGAFRLAYTSNVPVVPIFITMQDSEIFDNDGFYVQKYTINFLPPIFPDLSKKRKEEINRMKEENYNAWVKTYEDFYKMKLTY